MEVLREQAGLISPKNGCAPAGLVRLLHGARRRPGAVVVRGACPPGGGQARPDARGLRRAGAARLRARLRGDRRRCSAASASPASSSRRSTSSTRTRARRAAQIAEALNNHICRCTGYVKIIDAIESGRPGAARRAAAGGRLQRPRSAPAFRGRTPSAFVLGERPYVDDMRVDGMLRGAFLFSAHPRARVLRIDTAERCPAAGRRAGRHRRRRARRALPGPASSGTGRSSSPRARRPTASATSWRPSSPTPTATRGRRWRTSGSTTRCCPACSRPRPPSRPARRASTRITTTSSRGRPSPAATSTRRWPPRPSSRRGRSRRS